MKNAEKAWILGVRKFDGIGLNPEMEEGETFIGLASVSYFARICVSYPRKSAGILNPNILFPRIHADKKR